jgi:hypothetical protein
VEVRLVVGLGLQLLLLRVRYLLVVAGAVHHLALGWEQTELGELLQMEIPTSMGMMVPIIVIRPLDMLLQTGIGTVLLERVLATVEQRLVCLLVVVP